MPIKPLYLNKELEGDGRRVVVPNPKYPIRFPKNVRNLTLGTARFVLAEFENVNISYHSQSKTMVWVIEEWCLLNGYEYMLEENILGAVKITKIKNE